MTTPQSITSEIQKLAPSAIVELFEIDATAIGGDVLRVHAGTNQLRQNVVWQGNTYTAFPMQATGFDYSGNGQLPRPKLIMSNINGAMTLLVLTYEDLLGAKVTRRRTLVKYLDAVNFRRDNLLLWSENLSTSSHFSNQVTRINSNTITVVNTADPYIGQLVTGIGPLVGRTFSFGVEAKGVGSSIGKPLTLFMYSQSVNEVKASLVGYLSSEYTLFSITDTFNSSTDTGVHFRVDMEGSPAWAVGETLNLNRWRANEGSILSTYQFTTDTLNPTADPTAEFPVDIFYIDRKAGETRDIVEFELASSFDVAGVKLPRRQIVQNVCTWRYRGTECGYSGTNYFNANDAAVGSLALDKCGKRLSSCKARFGANNPLPFGSFPAAGLTR